MSKYQAQKGELKVGNIPNKENERITVMYRIDADEYFMVIDGVKYALLQKDGKLLAVDGEESPRDVISIDEAAAIERVIQAAIKGEVETIRPTSTASAKNPFGYFKPHEDMLPLIQETRDAYSAVHKYLLTLPASRERAVAITELETSAMWAIKGLVLNDERSTQPDESGVTGD